MKRKALCTLLALLLLVSILPGYAAAAGTAAEPADKPAPASDGTTTRVGGYGTADIFDYRIQNGGIPIEF